MSQRKQQILFFLMPSDEIEIATEVVKRIPEVKLVDEWRWEDPAQPPVRESPADSGGAIGLWHSGIAPTLTGTRRSNGTVDGPLLGPVVQWLRCRQSDGRLNSGRWAAAYDPTDKQTAAYVRTLWQIMTDATRNDLRRVSGDLTVGSTEERRFRVGRAAYQSALDSAVTLVANQLILAPE
jgi:hypothetical protein